LVPGVACGGGDDGYTGRVVGSSAGDGSGGGIDGGSDVSVNVGGDECCGGPGFGGVDGAVGGACVGDCVIGDWFGFEAGVAERVGTGCGEPPEGVVGVVGGTDSCLSS
jgi:hypothetical protein